jgi:hypothetical protein
MVIFEDPSIGGHNFHFFEESSLFFWLIIWSKARREEKDRWGN